jgi:hypothetical protein
VFGILLQPCRKVHVLVQDTDDTNVAVRQLAEEEIMMFVADEPDSGKTVTTDWPPMNFLPPEIMRCGDESAHIGVGLFLAPLSFCVIPGFAAAVRGLLDRSQRP